ncbi:MAG: hypothetical protein ACERLM_14135 [Acidimicrobiales bacterium]
MTDGPTEHLEQRLRRDLGEIADAVPVGERSSADTNVVLLTASDGGRRRRPALAVGACSARQQRCSSVC